MAFLIHGLAMKQLVRVPPTNYCIGCPDIVVPSLFFVLLISALQDN